MAHPIWQLRKACRGVYRRVAELGAGPHAGRSDSPSALPADGGPALSRVARGPPSPLRRSRVAATRAVLAKLRTAQPALSCRSVDPVVRLSYGHGLQVGR